MLAISASSLSVHTVLLPLDVGTPTLERLEVLRHWRGVAEKLEARERDYQETIAPQTYRDLAAVYDPKNADRVETTFAAFTPEGSNPGRDLGFGMHVVRRLKLPLPDGGERIVDVNEQWPEDRSSGGLLYPDEIRVKIQFRDGPRHGPGSENLYLYDSFRVAWGRNGRVVSLARRSRYRDEEMREKSRTTRMRSPVSAPFLCITCHHAGERLAKKFLEPGEERDGESIVQRSTFRKTLQDTPGWIAYEAYLQKRNVPADGLMRAFAGMESLRHTSSMAAIRGALAAPVVPWLGDDRVVEGSLARQGTYVRRGVMYLDAVEELLPGKYTEWTPVTAVSVISQHPADTSPR